MSMSEDEQRQVLSGVLGCPIDSLVQLTIGRVCAESRVKFIDELLTHMCDHPEDVDGIREHLRHQRFILASAAGLPTGYEPKIPR